MRRNLIAFFAAMFALSLFAAMPAKSWAGRWDEPKKEKNKEDEDSAKESDDDEAEEADEDEDQSADKDEADDSDEDDDQDAADDDEDDAAEVKEKSTEKSKEEKKPSPIKKLLEVKLDQNLIAARALNIPLPGKTRTVRDLVTRFEKWGKDDEIGAVILNLDGVYLSIPDVEELRAAVLELRKGGKKVVSFLNTGAPNDYLLACATDEIAAAPTGSLTIPGLGRLFPYMRGMYQMQGIEFDVITAGRFKYPGFMTQREPNKYFHEEFNAILDSWFGDYVKFIAEGRKLDEEKVKEAIDLALMNAQEAKNRGLIDVIAYYDEYHERVAKRMKYKKSSEFDSDFSKVTSFQDLLTAWQKKVKEAQESYKQVGPKIAILNARGPIIDVSLGSSYSSMLIMRDEFVKTIEEIRKNKTIRAVVLRIDSPGGSGYASDVIWRKLRELDEEKPVVVSMGSVAGSGGYYIACPARLIYAEPTTITGSIGVLGILPNQASALSRSDINIDEMKRGQRATLGSGHCDLKPEDRELIQKYMLDFYEIFLDRVAATRKMPKNEVRKIAEGRIYTGRQALEIGLVDRLGGLKDAIAAVREMADIPPSAEIKLVEYPKPATFGEFVEGIFGASTMMEIMSQTQMSVPTVTFDTQLRFFARRIEPLCWMAIPELDDVLQRSNPRDASLDLLGLPKAEPRLLPAP
ncbi:MAG TPA: signal peptide peptidase SppA [Phycisphaerae bacterium]|nr:signal peptide peptidase SppA [Phycisphaerae bacterium]